MGTPKVSTKMKASLTLLASLLVCLVINVSESKPWYQGDGLADCAPGLCPKTAEISPIKCSSASSYSSIMDTQQTVERVRSVIKLRLMQLVETPADLFLQRSKKKREKTEKAFHIKSTIDQ